MYILNGQVIDKDPDAKGWNTRQPAWNGYSIDVLKDGKVITGVYWYEPPPDPEGPFLCVNGVNEPFVSGTTWRVHRDKKKTFN